jgi:hypothetical protein
MNIKKYFISKNKNEIFITVTVSTPGIASSEVEITLTSGETIEKVKSTDGTGLIVRTSLGIAEDIVNGLIEIDTSILLNKIPSSDWQNCYDNLVIKYYLEGGIDNQSEPFLIEAKDKHKSVSGKTIGVEKYIKLSKKQ